MVTIGRNRVNEANVGHYGREAFTSIKQPTVTYVIAQSTFTGSGRKEGLLPPMPVNPGQPESRCSEARGGRNATQTMDELN